MFVWALTPEWVLLVEVLALMNQKMCPYLCGITLASVTVFAVSSGTNQWLLSWWPRESFGYNFFYNRIVLVNNINTFTIKGRVQCFSCSIIMLEIKQAKTMHLHMLWLNDDSSPPSPPWLWSRPQILAWLALLPLSLKTICHCFQGSAISICDNL